MKHLLPFLLLLSLNTQGQDSSENHTNLLKDMATCKVPWEDVRTNGFIMTDIYDFFAEKFTRQKRSVFIPKETMTLFDLEVVKVYPYAGMSPGFMVEINATAEELKSRVESELEMQLECVEQGRVCAKKLSETESLAIMNMGKVHLGCIYPYQR